MRSLRVAGIGRIGMIRSDASYDAFTASLNALPAVNLTALAAGIVMVSPVEGLRPLRSARAH